MKTFSTFANYKVSVAKNLHYNEKTYTSPVCNFTSQLS